MPFQPLGHILHDFGIVEVIAGLVVASWINLHFLIGESDLIEEAPGAIDRKDTL
jgi:hypothetical protein